jgi:hypothetical protein
MHTLHRSFQSLTMLTGDFFEIEFQEEDGKIHALSNQHRVHNQELVFSTWRPNLNLESTSSNSHKRAIPIYAQIVGRPPVRRTQGFLTEVMGHIAEVIWIDMTESYKCKVVGP